MLDISAFAQPLNQLWNSLVMFVPGLVGAILVLIVGYIVAAILGVVVKKSLDKTNFKKWLFKQTPLKKHLGDFRINRFLALIVKWWVFVLFFAPAAGLVKLEPLAYFLVMLGRWIPNFIVAVVLLFLGLVAAEYASVKIKDTKAKGAEFLATLAKIGILIYVVFAALEQVGIMVSIAKNSFLIILTGIVFGLSLAFGLAFGMGLKGEAAKVYSNFRKKL